MSDATYLKDLLLDTKDGDWGLEVSDEGHSAHYVIRGADFPSARIGSVESVPLRYLPDRSVWRRVLQRNDVLLETAGGTKDRPTGRSLLISKQLLASFSAPVIGASFTRFLRPDSAKIYGSFLFWYLQYLYATGEMYEYQVQHTGVARFQYTVFAESKVFKLPGIRTQKLIADVLDALDSKIAANHRVQGAVDKLLAEVLRALAADFGSTSLKAMADVNRGAVKPSAGGSLRYLDIAAVGVGLYEFPNLTSWSSAPGRARRKVTVGDTVWSTVRPNRRSHALILDDDPAMVASTGLAVLSPHEGRVASLYESSRRAEFVEYLESVAEGSAYPAVTAKRFYDAPVPDLPDDCWNSFEAFALPLRLRSHAASVENRFLESNRDELLLLLMSGSLTVESMQSAE